jgi:hypothetical protein
MRIQRTPAIDLRQREHEPASNLPVPGWTAGSTERIYGVDWGYSQVPLPQYRQRVESCDLTLATTTVSLGRRSVDRVANR